MSFFWTKDSIETKIISKQIVENSTDVKGKREFITSLISEFKSSPERLYMDTAWRYYRNDNDINKEVRTVIGRDSENNPCLVPSKVLSNNKLSHNYFKKLVRQKIGYMLGKPFILESRLEDDKITDEFIRL